jgi:hypothetical protein
MKLDLRDIPAKVISLPGEDRRRAHIGQHFGELGISFEIIDGVVGSRKIPSVALAHRNAFDAAQGVPFMVFEDDVFFCGESLVLEDVPDDADVIYLGKNDDGCLPNAREYTDRFGHRSLANLALASRHDDSWLRLHSMVSAHAILIVSELGNQKYREAQRISKNRITPLDVRYAYLMPHLNVYTPHRPLFAENPELQPKEKATGRRVNITHGALPMAEIGEVRHTHKRDEAVTVQVVPTENGRLEWDLIEM